MKRNRGVLFASIDYDFPKLELVCDGEEGKRGEPPEEMLAVVDAFNGGVWQYVLELEDVRDLGTNAFQQYNETDLEYRQYFNAYYGSNEITGTYEHGDLLDVNMLTMMYWGGAHGAESSKNFHFDLKTGEFFELSDLTDAPEKLRKTISDDIVNGIFDRDEEGWYFDGFVQTIEGREAYNVSFGEDGVDVIFDEYEIALYASGMPSFTVPYEKIARFSEDLVESRLNETTLAMFQEFDGTLYCAAAGRGTDWTVESVDYAMELNDAGDGGQILASIHRCELNEDTMERYSTGEVDQVAIPFTLGESGAVFDWFPTIW